MRSSWVNKKNSVLFFPINSLFFTNFFKLINEHAVEIVTEKFVVHHTSYSSFRIDAFAIKYLFLIFCWNITIIIYLHNLPAALTSKQSVNPDLLKSLILTWTYLQPLFSYVRIFFSPNYIGVSSILKMNWIGILLTLLMLSKSTRQFYIAYSSIASGCCGLCVTALFDKSFLLMKFTHHFIEALNLFNLSLAASYNPILIISCLEIDNPLSLFIYHVFNTFLSN